ncbi:N-acetyltransferase [Mesorhizobium sp.]|uniref:GNAT family N-acetyltransferase n=1 Tax=Mesorhizobium sp. TaxID=1871066 RepID=UPI00122B3136|nr:GNAT family N-acetyltransferase [Mesorhizobium sp.]TIT04306.1 MAG: GNAT family N-acetyltransferase [Mesorhizobium sp.]
MILDFGDGFFLRQATAADRAALAMICLKTGDAGKDATDREDDPDLLGLVYTIPYQVFEPDLAFVVDGPTGVSGYLLGAADTNSFNARLATDWYPELQASVTDPGPDSTRWQGSDWARHRIHHPDLSVRQALVAYPSHGHIDLLPQARGKGIGRQAMAFLEQRLAASGSTGLCLEVMRRNIDALNFYRAVGFEVLQDVQPPKDCVYVAKRLASAQDVAG